MWLPGEADRLGTGQTGLPLENSSGTRNDFLLVTLLLAVGRYVQVFTILT